MWTCGAVSCFICCFFFQAEDGIRDVAVTGVQTCALPIFADLMLRLVDPDCGLVRLDGRDLRALRLEDLRRRVVLVDQERSEERRVGKECRAWWVPCE